MGRKLNQRQPLKQVVLDSGCTALYMCKSIKKQADVSYSLTAQRTELEAYCIAQSWTICPEHVYVDAGESAKTTNRAEYQRMMEVAATGAIKRIVALKLDQVARNIKNFLVTVETLRLFGCDLVLIKENFDTSTPHGKFALTLVRAMAELEVSQMAEPVTRGKRLKGFPGGSIGSHAILGYNIVDGQCTPNEHTPTVQAIFAMFVGGKSLREISNHLNDTGVPTAKGGRWQATTVRYMLRNEFYTGVSRRDGIEVRDTHPAIVDAMTYEAACDKMMSKAKTAT